MKHLLILFSFFLIGSIFAQPANTDNDEQATTIEIPADFFDFMFRKPGDVYLVAWHGGVKVVQVISSDNNKVFSSDIMPFVGRLNDGLTSVYDSYFDYNMKDEMQQLVSPDKKVWYARCGLKSGNNINISPVTGKEIEGFPADIYNDVHTKEFTFKRSYLDAETKQRVVIAYRIEATSIYFSHIKKTDLKGEIKRSDGYKFCGRVAFDRLGPGEKTCLESVEVIDETYEFKELLYRGDYQVTFLWPGGSEMRLDDDFVYNPTDQYMPSDFNIGMFEGEISGKVRYKETERFAADYPVKLVPVCSESGLPQMETRTDKEGKYTFKDVPQGEYHIVVKGAEDENAFLVKKGQPKIKPEDSEIVFKYDIYATYTASGFAKAELLWKKAKIQFPDKGQGIQFFDARAFRNSGADPDAHPTGTDGKPLDIPYSMMVPGIGKQTLYGWPENESATPEVISVASLGGNKVFDAFRVRLQEEALNACNISQINNGAIYLELSFDLTGRYAKSDTWQQVAVRCVDDKEYEITRGGSLNGYPVTFNQIKFSPEEIENFQNYKAFEKTISNGRATLKIEFKLSEEDSH